MIAPGTVLAGRYRVVRHVGSGGMASVYLAEDTVLGRNVAVKRIHAAPESDLGRRIRREARIGARLRHPNLVTVFDVLADGEALLLTMEFVDGETLADAIKRGPFAPDRAIAVLRPLAAALDDLHAEGVVHRDVKPANVLLGGRGTVKLSDLGVATSSEATQITRTGGLVGTVAYMAPEQLEPGPVTGAADVYALAVVAFEVLAGRKAYAGATPFEILGRVHDGAEPPDLREHRPDLGEAGADALRRGMTTRPADRTPTAGALVDELAAGLGVGRPASPPPTERAPDPTQTMQVVPRADPPSEAPPSPGPQRSRRTAPVLALLGLVLVAGVAAALVLAGGGGEEDPAPDRGEAPATQARTSPRSAAATPTQAAADPSTPAGAVRAFYERAAEDDFDGAWALAGPGVRSAFGGSIAQLEGTLGTLQSISFPRLQETDRTADTATLAFRSVARHTDRVDRCSGTIDTQRAGGGAWRLERLGVSC